MDEWQARYDTLCEDQAAANDHVNAAFDALTEAIRSSIEPDGRLQALADFQQWEDARVIRYAISGQLSAMVRARYA